MSNLQVVDLKECGVNADDIENFKRVVDVTPVIIFLKLDINLNSILHQINICFKIGRNYKIICILFFFKCHIE